jgi:hypothetical protein
MKYDPELIKHVMQRNELDVRQINSILEELEKEAQAVQAENPPAPRQKKQFAILVSDPEGDLDGKDFTGWVLQLPEEDSPQSAEERIVKSAYDFNMTPKGRRMPVRSIGEGCEAIPARIAKEHGVWIKTKEPVLVVTTGNTIPYDEASAKAFN